VRVAGACLRRGGISVRDLGTCFPTVRIPARVVGIRVPKAESSGQVAWSCLPGAGISVRVVGICVPGVRIWGQVVRPEVPDIWISGQVLHLGFPVVRIRSG
jgi:hypothetical protein